MGYAGLQLVSENLMQELCERLIQSFGCDQIVHQKADLSLLRVDKDKLESTLFYLKTHEGFVHLSFVTVIDYIEDNIFRLSYMLHNYETRADLAVQTEISRTDASMHSIHHLWAQGWTYQRELKEMYGIDFPGSPRVNDEFVLEGWDGPPPMLRDFDTVKFCEERFVEREGRETQDIKQTMRDNLYPERGED